MQSSKPQCSRSCFRSGLSYRLLPAGINSSRVRRRRRALRETTNSRRRLSASANLPAACGRTRREPAGGLYCGGSRRRRVQRPLVEGFGGARFRRGRSAATYGAKRRSKRGLQCALACFAGAVPGRGLGAEGRDDPRLRPLLRSSDASAPCAAERERCDAATRNVRSRSGPRRRSGGGVASHGDLARAKSRPEASARGPSAAKRRRCRTARSGRPCRDFANGAASATARHARRLGANGRARRRFRRDRS